MFKNLKIGVRLGIGFGIVVLLLVITAVVSIERLGELNSATKEITENRMPKIEMAMEIEKNAQALGLALRNLILTDDKATQKVQIEVIAKARQRNDEILEAIKPLINTEAGKALLEKLGQARVGYGAAIDAVLPLADSASPQHSAEKATSFLFKEFPPIAGSYVESTKAFFRLSKEERRANRRPIGRRGRFRAPAGGRLIDRGGADRRALRLVHHAHHHAADQRGARRRDAARRRRPHGQARSRQPR